MSCFKIGFDIVDYKDWGVLPDPEEYAKHDQILYANDFGKGNNDLCYWRKEEPDPRYVLTTEFKEREARRILKTGVWACIKEELVWLPPNYYHFLQYGNANGDAPQFRLKRIKHIYEKIRARKNPFCLGTYTIKNRQDGETTQEMSDAMWEMADGNMENGAIGIQSKTRDTVVLSCWRTLQMQWDNYPQWLKEMLYYDYISGDKNEQKFKFKHPKSEGDKGRDILCLYGPCVHNAFDSVNNMRKCKLDEVNKWEECSFYETFLNYKKFIAPGLSRKGLFDIFSSPADKNGRWNDEAYQFWKECNPSELNEHGTPKSRVFRIVSNPLDGIEGFYDKFGDADPDAIKDWIIRERESVDPEKKLGEIRGYPLNEEEMFGATEGSELWDNMEGIKARKLFLVGARFKDKKKTDPVKVYGNLERVDGYVDGDVFFRPADIDHFDVHKARFCFSYLPQHSEPLDDVKKPPMYVESCLGVDPYNLRYDTKSKQVRKKSNGAMVNWKFRDLYQTGIVKRPTMTYCNRPHHQNIFFEDVLRAGIFNRALIQYENRSDKLANYIEDAGYFDWLLPEIGATDPQTKRKGDAPSSSGAFLLEGMGLINAVTNIPLDEFDPYLLLNNWHYELLVDITEKFNPKDTHEADLTMAWIQSLIGAVKIMYKKVKKPSDLNDAALTFLLG